MLSLVRLLAVGLVVAVVLTVSVGVVARIVRRRDATLGAGIVLSLGILIVAAGAYAFWEPYRPEIVVVSLTSSKIVKGRSIRIVQLSDTHTGDHLRLEEALPDAVRGLQPDVIVFTGDAVNMDAGVEPFRRLMTALAEIAPTFAVRGNWDVWWFPQARLFEKTGVRELRAEAAAVRVHGMEIWIAGVPVDSENATDAALARVPKQSFLLFLHHFPWAAQIAAEHGADLFLTGDTHGGQIQLPLLGELVRIARHGAWRPAGLGREGNTWVYVNRGIGMEGGLPPVRFLCRPEITLIEVSGE